MLPRLPLTPIAYRRLAWYTLFAYWIVRMSVGSHSPWDWAPWGLLQVGLLGAAGALLVRAHRRGRYQGREFQGLSGLCLLQSGLLLAEAIMHLRNPQPQLYALGSLMGVAVVGSLWLAERQGAWLTPDLDTPSRGSAP